MQVNRIVVKKGLIPQSPSARAYTCVDSQIDAGLLSGVPRSHTLQCKRQRACSVSGCLPAVAADRFLDLAARS